MAESPGDTGMAEDIKQATWRGVLLKLLVYPLPVLLAACVATFVFIIREPSWHQHLVNLLARAGSNFVTLAVGSTWRGFINAILVSLFSIAGTVLYVGSLFGRSAMKKHLGETAAIALAVFATVMVLIYVPQFAWEVIKTTSTDHNDLVSTNRALRAENKTLANQLRDAQENAQQRCEQAKGGEIKRLKKQMSAVCFNPDRRLDQIDKDQLFANLKRIRAEMQKQNRIPNFAFLGFSGDAEAGRLFESLLPLFTTAQWNWKISAPIKPDEIALQKKQQEEREKWMFDHNMVVGVFVFDKNWPKGFGSSVGMALNGVGLGDYGLANNQVTTELPYLPDDVITIWIGYKSTLSKP